MGDLERVTAPFEPKDEIREAAEAVAGVFASRPRGTVVGYPEIERVAGFALYSTHWTAFRKRLGRLLRDAHGLTIEAVRGVGFRTHTVDEQLFRRSVSRQQRAVRQLAADVDELEALPDAGLSDHQRLAKVRKVDLGRAGKRAVTDLARVGRLLARPGGCESPRPRPR